MKTLGLFNISTHFILYFSVTLGRRSPLERRTLGSLIDRREEEVALAISMRLSLPPPPPPNPDEYSNLILKFFFYYFFF